MAAQAKEKPLGNLRYTFGFEYFKQVRVDGEVETIVDSVGEEFYGELSDHLVYFYEKVMLGKYKPIAIPEDDDDIGIEKVEDKKVLWKADRMYESQLLLWMDVHLKVFHYWIRPQIVESPEVEVKRKAKKGKKSDKTAISDSVVNVPTRVNFATTFKNAFLEGKNPFRVDDQTPTEVESGDVGNFDCYSHNRWTLMQDLILDYFLEDIQGVEDMEKIANLGDDHPEFQRAVHMMLCFLSMNYLFTKYICVEGKLTMDHIKDVFVDGNFKYLYTTPPSMSDVDNPAWFNQMLNRTDNDDFKHNETPHLMLEDDIRDLPFDLKMDKHLWLFYRERGTKLALTKPSQTPFLFVPTFLKLRMDRNGFFKEMFSDIDFVRKGNNDANIVPRTNLINEKITELNGLIAREENKRDELNGKIQAKDTQLKKLLELLKVSEIFKKMFSNGMKKKQSWDNELWNKFLVEFKKSFNGIWEGFSGEVNGSGKNPHEYIISKTNSKTNPEVIGANYWTKWDAHKQNTFDIRFYRSIGISWGSLGRLSDDISNGYKAINMLKRELSLENHTAEWKLQKNQLRLELESLNRRQDTAADVRRREEILEELFSTIKGYKFLYRRTLHQPHRGFESHYKTIGLGNGTIAITDEKIKQFKKIPKQDDRFYYAAIFPEDLERGVRHGKDVVLFQKYEKITNLAHPESTYYRIVDNFDKTVYKPRKDGRSFPITSNVLDNDLKKYITADPFCFKKSTGGSAITSYHHVLGPYVRYPYAPEIILPIITKDYIRPYLLQEIIYPVRLFVTGEMSGGADDDGKEVGADDDGKEVATKKGAVTNPVIKKQKTIHPTEKKPKSKFTGSGSGVGVGLKRSKPDPVILNRQPIVYSLPELDQVLDEIEPFKTIRGNYKRDKAKPQDPFVVEDIKTVIQRGEFKQVVENEFDKMKRNDTERAPQIDNYKTSLIDSWNDQYRRYEKASEKLEGYNGTNRHWDEFLKVYGEFLKSFTHLPSSTRLIIHFIGDENIKQYLGDSIEDQFNLIKFFLEGIGKDDLLQQVNINLLPPREMIFVGLLSRIMREFIQLVVNNINVEEDLVYNKVEWTTPILDIFTNPENYKLVYDIKDRLSNDIIPVRDNDRYKNDPLYKSLVEYRDVRMSYITLNHACSIGCLDTSQLSKPISKNFPRFYLAPQEMVQDDAMDRSNDQSTFAANDDGFPINGDDDDLIGNMQDYSNLDIPLLDDFNFNFDDFMNGFQLQPVEEEPQENYLPLLNPNVQVQAQVLPRPIELETENEWVQRLSRFDYSASMKQYIKECVEVITQNARIMDLLYREDIVARYYHDRLSSFVLTLESTAKDKFPDVFDSGTAKLVTNSIFDDYIKDVFKIKKQNYLDERKAKENKVKFTPADPPKPPPDPILDHEDYVRYTTTELPTDSKFHPRGKRAEKLFTNTFLELYGKINGAKPFTVKPVVTMNLGIAVCVTTTKKYIRVPKDVSVVVRAKRKVKIDNVDKEVELSMRIPYNTQMKFPIPVPSQNTKMKGDLSAEKQTRTGEQIDVNVTYEWIPIELVGTPEYDKQGGLMSLVLHGAVRTTELFTEYMSRVTKELYMGKAGYSSVSYDVRLIYTKKDEDIGDYIPAGTMNREDDIHCVDFLRDYETKYKTIDVKEGNQTWRVFHRSCMDFHYIEESKKKAAWLMIRGMNKTPILLCSTGRMDELPSSCDPLKIGDRGANGRGNGTRNDKDQRGAHDANDTTEEDDTEYDDDTEEEPILIEKAPGEIPLPPPLPRYQIGAGITALKNDGGLIGKDEYDPTSDNHRVSGIEPKYQWVNLLEFVYTEIYKKFLPKTFISISDPGTNTISNTSIWNQTHDKWRKIFFNPSNLYSLPAKKTSIGDACVSPLKQNQENFHSFFIIATRRKVSYGCNLQPRNTKNVSLFYLEGNTEENILKDLKTFNSATLGDKRRMGGIVNEYNKQMKGFRIRDCYQFNRSHGISTAVTDIGFSSIGSFYCRDVLYYKHFIQDNTREIGSMSVLFSLQNTKDEYIITPTNTTTVMRSAQSYFPHVVLPICITPGYPYLDQLVEWKQHLNQGAYVHKDLGVVSGYRVFQLQFPSHRDLETTYPTKGAYIRTEIKSVLGITREDIIQRFFHILGVTDVGDSDMDDANYINPPDVRTEDYALYQFLQNVNTEEKYNEWKDLCKNVFIYVVHRSGDKPVEECPYFFYEYSKESMFMWLNTKDHPEKYHVCCLVCRVNNKSLDRRPGSVFNWSDHNKDTTTEEDNALVKELEDLKNYVKELDKQLDIKDIKDRGDRTKIDIRAEKGRINEKIKELVKRLQPVEIRKESSLNPTDGDYSLTGGSIYCSTTLDPNTNDPHSRPELYRVVDPGSGIIHANLALVEPGIVGNSMHYVRIWRYFQQLEIDRGILKVENHLLRLKITNDNDAKELGFDNLRNLLRDLSLSEGKKYLEEVSSLCMKYEALDPNVGADERGKLKDEILYKLAPPMERNVKFQSPPLSERVILSRGDNRGGKSGAKFYIQKNTNPSVSADPVVHSDTYNSDDRHLLFPALGYVYHPRTRSIFMNRKETNESESIPKIFQRYHTKEQEYPVTRSEAEELAILYGPADNLREAFDLQPDQVQDLFPDDGDVEMFDSSTN